MIGYAKKIEKITRGSAFDKKKNKPGLKFNPGLALTGVRTTGSRTTMSVESFPSIKAQSVAASMYV